jgi:O-succinylbenzoate synthase
VKPAGFRLYRYHLPLSEPLQSKGTTLRHREGLLVELASDRGAVGWGEASPLPGFSRENLDEAAEQLRGLATELMGRRVTTETLESEGSFARELDLLAPSPSVRFGLELALWNLYAAHQGKSLPKLMTPYSRTTVPVNALISGPPERALEEARRMRAAGYEAVKVKVGGRSVEEDVELVYALCKVLGDDVSVRLDANRAWSFEEASIFARGAANLRFEYVEEPLADPSRLSSLVRDYGVPVALDESLAGMPPLALQDHEYARAVVLKPTLLGGISATLRLANRARELGITPVISSAYETGVGTSALVALAAGVGEVPAGLDTYRRLAHDVLVPGLRLPSARIDVRAMLGTQREMDHRWLTPVG